MSGNYDDIINLPHHVSETHPQMPLRDRAAQFAPFQALTGYGDAVDETARVTDERDERGEEASALLDRKLSVLNENLASGPEVSVLYFVPDEKKAGGKYETYSGKLRTIDTYSGLLVFTDGIRLNIADVYGIESELFREKTDGND